MASKPPKRPPGWYPDSGGGHRYWDGEKWTQHRAGLSNVTWILERSLPYVGAIAVTLVVWWLVVHVHFA
jgi:hypothetical protein